MGLLPRFNKNIKDWISSVNGAIKKELKDNSKKYQELFTNINTALNVFSQISEHLPKDNAIWIHGEEEIVTQSSSIQIIMEFLTQAIYMQASHLWPAANHSARCAIEHTVWSIWQIVYPKESQTKIGGLDQPKFKDMKNALFEVSRFASCDIEIKLDKQTKKISDHILQVYRYLSHYVHTSNIHIELKGKRPHITHDLATNPKAERDTQVNISQTLTLIVIMLSIACKENLEKDHIKQIKTITSIDISKLISKNKKK